MGKKIHQKIYEQHYGPIPKDNEGRSYEIHHIDGNHDNNLIDNLKLVTIEEHYRIHYDQGNYGACFLIAKRMKLSPTEISKIGKDAAKQMAEKNQLFFQTERGKEYTRNKNREKAKNGTHPAQSPEFRKFSSMNATKRNRINNKIPNICDQCGKTILGKANLARHQRGKYCIKSVPPEL